MLLFRCFETREIFHFESAAIRATQFQIFVFFEGPQNVIKIYFNLFNFIHFDLNFDLILNFNFIFIRVRTVELCT